ncbi:MAG TPA: exosortase system-associated protein, TIGR04073 family [Candidatus Baltobacteraceae bacterium]|nr:exosortase system-associated protein, TIGR04073 family [Candidatus Baltobacteraceae bacterium]
MPILAVIAFAALFTSGCAGPEEKFGRGMRNTYEVVRLGEMRRSIEQTSVFDSPEAGMTTGLVRGLDRSLARTGVGIYEMVTAPLPPYGPVFTKYLKPEPVYPESYKPGLLSDSIFNTDTYTGYSGGDVAPWFPGSRFRVFDN